MAFTLFAFIIGGAFLILATRWLLVLRRASLDAKLKLTTLDRVMAAAPIAYTLFCIYAGHHLVDRALEVMGAGGATPLPLLGTVDARTAIFTLWLLSGLAVASPLVVIFTVETYFGGKLPDLVRLGRQAVYSTLTGVKPPASKKEDEWKELLRE